MDTDYRKPFKTKISLILNSKLWLVTLFLVTMIPTSALSENETPKELFHGIKGGRLYDNCIAYPIIRRLVS